MLIWFLSKHFDFLPKILIFTKIFDILTKFLIFLPKILISDQTFWFLTNFLIFFNTNQNCDPLPKFLFSVI